jgi:TPP-dependent pyruvate/acetoin dehydrogenase alpha subunit
MKKYPGKGVFCRGAKASGVSPETLINLFTIMLRIRKVEEELVGLYPEQEMKCPTHFHIGQEAVAAGVCANLRTDDLLFCSHRSHAPYIAKGGDIKGLVAELYGKVTGCCSGKAGSQHLMDPEVGLMGTSAIVGGTLPMAVGAALAFSMRKQKRVSAAIFGDGGVEEGIFQESLNFAALRKLPVLFVCENNLYATHSHISSRQAKDNIYTRGEIYGIPGVRVNGNNVLEVYAASREAVRNARTGQGPTLIECRTYRWLEHVGPCYDYELGYRTKEELDAWMKGCPLKTFENTLLSEGILSGKGRDGIVKGIEMEIKEAVLFAKKSPYPDASDLMKDVY